MRSHPSAAMRAKQALQKLVFCDHQAVRIFGPYHESEKKRWRVVVSGSRSRVNLFCKSQQEAAAVVSALHGELHAASSLLLGNALKLYLDHKALAGLKPASLRSVEGKLSRLLPLEQTVKSITENSARALYSELMAQPGKKGLMAAATHHAALRGVKEFWRWLIETQRASSNPWTAVKPVGRAEFGKQQARHGEAELLDRALFEDAKKGNEGALALLLQIYAGLRSSEVLALRVADIDRITAREGVKQTQVYVLRGKTRNAKRSIKLYEGVAALLHKFCEGRSPTERVFAANRSQQPKPPWLWKRLRTYCRRLGLPRLCPHSLRGLNATLAIEGGATTDAVAASLGHANFAITAKHYADPSAVLNAALGKIPAAFQHQSGLDKISQLLVELSPDERQQLRNLLG